MIEGRLMKELDSVKYGNGGLFTSRGEWIHPEATNRSTQIILVTDGEFELEENGEIYQLAPGKGIFLDAGIPHRGVESNDSRVSFFWFHFAIDELPKVKCFTLRDHFPVILLCRQLLHYAELRFDPIVTDSLMRVLLAEILSQIVLDESEHALVSKICEWIRINSDRTLNAPEISERFGYNEDYISRLLKTHTGHTLKSMIDEYKMNRIKALLLETEKTLSDISAHTGFKDYKLFLKFFKYHEGVTPTEYRSIYYRVHTNNH